MLSKSASSYYRWSKDLRTTLCSTWIWWISSSQLRSKSVHFSASLTGIITSIHCMHIYIVHALYIAVALLYIHFSLYLNLLIRIECNKHSFYFFFSLQNVVIDACIMDEDSPILQQVCALALLLNSCRVICAVGCRIGSIHQEYRIVTLGIGLESQTQRFSQWAKIEKSFLHCGHFSHL